MIGTGLYRLVYLGTTPSLEKVFTVAEAVAGHPCHDPPRSEDKGSGRTRARVSGMTST